MKLFFSFWVLFGLLVTSADVTWAVSDPPLFACNSPVGLVSSQYGNGVHGVPGQANTYAGADTVYQIDDDHVLQCLCPDNATSGIQSNWWKVSGLSQSDIEYFQRRGWVLVPDGSLWGLAAAPYLVKNDSYACQGGVGGVSTSADSAGGAILGVSTLGATGSSIRLLALLGAAGMTGFLALRLARE